MHAILKSVLILIDEPIMFKENYPKEATVKLLANHPAGPNRMLRRTTTL